MRLFVLFSAIAVTAAQPAQAQVSGNDGFDPNVNGLVLATDQLADGRLVIGGSFTSVSGQARNRFALVTPSGAVDPSFAVTFGNATAGNAVLAEGDGGFIVAGSFATVDGVFRTNIARFLASGALDTGFNPTAGGIDGPITALARDSAGRIIVAGDFNQFGGQTRPDLVRLLPNGAIDPSFNFGTVGATGGIDHLAVDEQDRIWICGEFLSVAGQPRSQLARVQANGALDPITRNLNGYCSALNFARDGQLWVGGNFTMIDGQARQRMARLDRNSNVGPALPAPDGNYISVLKPLRNGDMLVAGDFLTIGGLPRQRLARLTRNGTVLPNFTTVVGDGVPFAAVEQQDRQIVIGGGFATVNSVARNRLARLYPEGSLDRAVSLQSVANIEAFMSTPNYQTYFAGAFTSVNGVPKSRLARVRADGQLDSIYSLGIESTVRSLAPANRNGAFWLGGDFISINGQPRSGLARTDDEGALDAFSPISTTASARIAIQQDGKILVAPRCRAPELCPATYPIVRRYLADGTVDASFSAPMVNNTITVSGICPLSNGEIVITGDFDANGILGHPSMIKLSSSGARVPAWPFHAIPSTVRFAEGCLTHRDTFYVAHDPAPGVWPLMQFSTDGAVNMTFNTANRFVASGEAIPRIHDALLREDGKLLVAGNFSAVSGPVTRPHLALLQFDGTLDTAFDAQVTGQSINRMLLQDDAKLWTSGRFTQIGGSNRIDLVRLKLPGPSLAKLTVHAESVELEFRRFGGVGPTFNHPPQIEISADGVNYSSLGFMTGGGSWRYTGSLQGYGSHPTIRISTTISTLAGNTLPYSYVEQIYLTEGQGGNDVIFVNGVEP